MKGSESSIFCFKKNYCASKFEAQPTNGFFAAVNQVFKLLLASDYCRALFRHLNCAQRFDYRTVDSSGKLGGVAEHLIDGSEN